MANTIKGFSTKSGHTTDQVRAVQRCDQPNKIKPMSRSSSLLTLAIGLAAGAALGILLAPASGKDTRKSILKKGEKLRDQLSDLMDQGKDLMGDAMDKAKDSASDVASKAKDAANQAKNDFGNRAQEAGARASSAARS